MEVDLPAFLVPEIEAHLAAYVGADADALVFAGPKGAPLRRNNWNPKWRDAVEKIGKDKRTKGVERRQRSATVARATSPTPTAARRNAFGNDHGLPGRSCLTGLCPSMPFSTGRGAGGPSGPNDGRSAPTYVVVTHRCFQVSHEHDPDHEQPDSDQHPREDVDAGVRERRTDEPHGVLARVLHDVRSSWKRRWDRRWRCVERHHV
jgi:hypothetical protein